MIDLAAEAFQTGDGLSGAESIAILCTAGATLITALGGFIAVLLRQRHQQEKLDTVHKEINHVVADEQTGDTMTLWQTVRSIHERLGRIEADLGIEDRGP